VEALLAWFRRQRRDLPWRHDKTPYRVLVAEVMLQQTQAATVVPYFERFLARFPSLESLAEAPLDEVLKSWEGLGYYRRARLLHRAAGEITRSGRFPESYGELLELPGIGPYTAAAMASLAFGERVLAVDGNVKRVAARLFMLPAPGEKELRNLLEPLMPASDPGGFNEALMDLGATVCTPKAPRCHECPIQGACAAYRAGRVEDFPRARARKAVPLVKKCALVHRQNGALWLHRREEGAMLGGLWGFPLQDEQPLGEVLEAVSHAYTHFRIEVLPVLAATGPAPGLSGRWAALADIATLALSRLDHKILARLKEL
jgi:A/G-specific adenine glycosylase